VNWAAAERSLGIDFPAGYRWLAETYGPGCFDGFLRFHVPGAPIFDLLTATAANTEITRARLGDRHAPPFPYPLHPEPGGLVVWATTYADEVLAWPTTGAPDRWPTIVEDYEALGTDRFDGPPEQLIVELLQGTLEIHYLSTEPYRPPHTFEPDRRSALQAALRHLPRAIRRNGGGA
jgi:hypothetical protein